MLTSDNVILRKEANIKQAMNVDPIWKSIFYNKKRPNNYIAYTQKGNKPICLFAIEKEKIVLELYIIVYRLSGVKKSITSVCELLFDKYPDIEKITVHLLSPERLGKLILKTCGFKREVKVEKLYKINKKKHDYLVYARFR